MPRSITMVEVGSSIAGNVDATPPKIEMQLIGVNRPRGVVGATYHSPTVTATQKVIATAWK